MDTLHVLIARAMVLYYVLLGVWGLWLAVRRAPLDGAYRGALVMGLGLAVLQALVGVLLVLVGGRGPRDDLHYLYGLSVIVTLPLVHQYLTGRARVAPTLAYGVGALFMMGLALRGFATGA